jgi:hypothetical protein
MDYTYFYKECFENGNINFLIEYDYFFSAFDGCERTQKIFDSIKAVKKVWINFPQYENKLEDLELFNCTSYREDESIIELLSKYSITTESVVCIDITGFIRPHLIFLIVYLNRLGIKKIDLLYTEPERYENAEETTFSGIVDEVRIIEGCGSEYINPNTENDLLIICAGYDDKLIASIAKNKSKIKNKYYILGFPSLQPDMYQESVLKMYSAKDSIGHKKIDRFAPAFDPFVTAQVISEIINENPAYSNVYLSPLATKPQTIGIALFYLWNYRTIPLNIIFPFSSVYKTKTAVGIKRTWKYTFELP